MQKKFKIFYKLKRKVLIFEKDAFLTDIYIKKFRECEFEVKSYNNYDKPFVVDVVAEENPNIIYCDIVMPGMDGCCKKIVSTLVF